MVYHIRYMWSLELKAFLSSKDVLFCFNSFAMIQIQSDSNAYTASWLWIGFSVWVIVLVKLLRWLDWKQNWKGRFCVAHWFIPATFPNVWFIPATFPNGHDWYVYRSGCRPKGWEHLICCSRLMSSGRKHIKDFFFVCFAHSCIGQI